MPLLSVCSFIVGPIIASNTKITMKMSDKTAPLFLNKRSLASCQNETEGVIISSLASLSKGALTNKSAPGSACSLRSLLFSLLMTVRPPYNRFGDRVTHKEYRQQIR